MSSQAPQIVIQRPRWNPAYAIGNELVDTQHQRLFELLSMLVDAYEGNCDPEVTDYAVSSLYGYIRIHFADEEQLMSDLGHHGLEDHRRLHDGFILSFDDLVQRYQRTSELLPRLIDFVARWLVDHIAVVDTTIRAGRVGEPRGLTARPESTCRRTGQNPGAPFAAPA